MTPPSSVGARAALAIVLAAAAWAMYRATLLPGLDFGDTAAFQTVPGALDLSPRQAYPLYFAVGNAVYWLTGASPATAMNLSSALCGALAVGATAWVGAALTGSLAAGAFGALLLAASYTFWSQAVIAEVYTLHLLLVALTLAALLAWRDRPTTGRLAGVCAIYALGFGNHLMMVLLAPAIVLFLAVTAPGGVRGLLTPRVAAIAAACAIAGAAQYAWNAAYLLSSPDKPQGLADLASAFWFDVTKSDWRQSMVMAVHESALRNRAGMYWFDIRQQVGVTGVVLAVIGALSLARRWRLLLLLTAGYAPALVFAYTYNVGDAHVFFLPSHLFVILAAAQGTAFVAALAGRGSRRAWVATAAGVLLTAYPAWRAYDTWPAVDRSGDDRPARWLAQATAGLGGDRALFLDDLNWQLQNGLDYHVRHEQPDVLSLRASGRLLAAPYLVADNLAAGRFVSATPVARQLLSAAYGDLFRFEPDPLAPAAPLAARLRGLPAGTPYVLAVLAPYRDLAFDQDELAEALVGLGADPAKLPPGSSYSIVAGRVGRPPDLVRQETRPFRQALELDGLALDIRMESWLPADTMRRAGFGHVIAGRRHALTLERGVGFVAFGPGGGVLRTEYASSLFQPLARYRVSLPPASAASGP